jgi:hypothetical protein
MLHYYDILGVRPDASDDEIKDAYTFQIKVFHPDVYNPDTHPTQYARALTMTQRLNESRDVLLDPATRAAYDATLASPRPSAPPPPARNAPPTPKPRHLQQAAFWSTIGVMLLLGSLATLRAPQPSGSTLGAVAPASTPTPSPIPCPNGEPTVTVDHVDIRPDPDSFTEEDTKNRRLYIVSGTLTNTTNADIAATALGFYLGTTVTDAAPDWTETLANMDVVGDPNSIPPGGVLSWKSKDVVDWDVSTRGPHPANVVATVTFPYSSTTKTEPQWVANSCQ